MTLRQEQTVQSTHINKPVTCYTVYCQTDFSSIRGEATIFYCNNGVSNSSNLCLTLQHITQIFSRAFFVSSVVQWSFSLTTHRDLLYLMIGLPCMILTLRGPHPSFNYFLYINDLPVHY